MQVIIRRLRLVSWCPCAFSGWIPPIRIHVAHFWNELEYRNTSEMDRYTTKWTGPTNLRAWPHSPIFPVKLHSDSPIISCHWDPYPGRYAKIMYPNPSIMSNPGIAPALNLDRTRKKKYSATPVAL